MKDFKIDPYNRDYVIENNDLALTEDIRNNIYLSLSVRKGEWAFSPESGSRLHLLMREKSLERLESVAKEYCEEALRWIIDLERAEKIEVTTVLDKENKRMKCLIEATQKGKPIIYEHFVRV